VKSRACTRHRRRSYLVDGTRDDTRDVSSAIEDEGEGAAEARRRLGGREGYFANRVRISEAEYAPGLVEGYQLLNFHHVPEKRRALAVKFQFQLVQKFIRKIDRKY